MPFWMKMKAGENLLDRIGGNVLVDLPRLRQGWMSPKKQLSSEGFQNSAFIFLFYNMMPEAAAFQNLNKKPVVTGGVILTSVFERKRQFTDTNLLEF